MKILHVIGLAHGGAGQHVLSLASGCDRRRFESTVAMTHSSPMRPQFEAAGVRVLPLALDHYGGLRRNVVAFQQLAAILKREAYDIVHTHTSVAGALGRIAARRYTRTPVVHMLHAFAGHAYRRWPSRFVASAIERRLDRSTDWYIAGSKAMIERGVATRIFRRDKAVLISNGIDLAPFRALHSAHEVEPAKQGADSKTVTVGFLGRLEQQKGVPYLVRAAAIVRRHNPHIKFVLAGDGSMRQMLERLAEELGVSDIVEFVGWKRDVVAFLNQIDIMAMPSLWEAFGLSAAEAMALEKPVIASRIEGLPEVLGEGVGGLLVPPADEEALACAILELAADPVGRREMGARGRERVEAFYSLDLMVRRHEEFYLKIAGEPHSRSVAGVKRERRTASALSLTEG